MLTRALDAVLGAAGENPNASRLLHDRIVIY